MSKVLVIGSTNLDLVIQVPRLPKPGETVGGGKFLETQGGKGANQAVAAARAGGEVAFISCVGDDVFGNQALNQFVREGMQVEYVFILPDAQTGIAMIFVDAAGENCIALAPGANDLLLPELIKPAEDSITQAGVILLQLEIPLETVRYVLEIIRDSKTKVIFNPAPAQKLPDDMLSAIHTLVVNRTETEILIEQELQSESEVHTAAAELLERGPENVVITLGAKGILAVNKDETIRIPAYKVEAVDTTAAGDVFCGNLAVGIADGKSLYDALIFANAASALSVKKLGARSSAPEKAAILDFLKTHPI